MESEKIKPNADNAAGGSKRKATEEVMVQDIKKKFADDVFELNVGGKLITTLKSTLAKEPKSKLADMLSKPGDIVKDKDGRCFIDCDGETFVYILNFLRSGTLPRRERVLEVYDLASKYRVLSLVEQLEQYFVVQYRNKIAKIKEDTTKSKWCEDMKNSLISEIQDNGYFSPKEDISIYDAKPFARCIYCPIRPANLFLNSSDQYSDDMRTLVMYELCELGYGKNIDTKKINKKCNICNASFDGIEIVLVAN